MKLSSLLLDVEYTVVCGNADLEVTGISRDNRSANPSDVFLCIEGPNFDTHNDACVAKLCEAGQVAFVVEKEIAVPEGYTGTVLRVKNSRSACSYMYAALFDHPAKKLTLVGITGSKGKTTTTFMAASILREAGHNVGTIGTNGLDYNDVHREIHNTTPDSYELQEDFREMLDAGIDTVILEVSSQAHKMHRIDGVVFDYGVWTNLYEDDHIVAHEHENLADYISCKAAFINQCKKAYLNYNDPHRDVFMSYLRKDLDYEFFGTDASHCHYTADTIEKHFDPATRTAKVSFSAHGFNDVNDSDQGRIDILMNEPGEFNVWNALGAMMPCSALGATADDMKRGLLDVHIEARAQIVFKGEKFMVCIDIAHNGCSTRNHLMAMREYHPKRLVCLISADGNRDINRRLGMGEEAGKLADFCIVTTGHNRMEAFETICGHMVEGLHRAPDPHYIIIENRKEAIRYALTHAEEGDLISIIDIGNKKYQDCGGVVTPYSDAEYVAECVKELGLK